jgi:flagellar hook-basal body complex protein FliE
MSTIGIGPRAAASAYKKALERINGPEQGNAPMTNFGEVMKAQVTDAIQSSRVAEQRSGDAALGKADLQQVVEAVTAAELNLSTVTAVRDRVVAAYQEIMRMTI